MFTLPLSAQVFIKDSIEINPLSNILKESLQSGAYLVLVDNYWTTVGNTVYGDAYYATVSWNLSIANYGGVFNYSLPFRLSDGLYLESISNNYQTIYLAPGQSATLVGSKDSIYLRSSNWYTFRMGVIREGPRPSYVVINNRGDSAVFYFTIDGIDYGLRFMGTVIFSIHSKVQKKLKIVDREPREIWPTLPPQTTGESRGADRSGYNPKRGFKITVLDGSNQPVKAEEVKVFTTFEQGSGGHGHTNGDKALPQDKQGLFYRKEKKGNPLFLTTDTNGVVEIDSLVASQVSGKYLVTATLKADTTVKDTMRLNVMIPNFVEFGAGDYWSLTGNTNTEGQNHPSNHWCTQKMKDSLSAALQEFYEWTLTEKGGKKAIKIGANDMSLKWGGVFEYPGRWEFGVKHSFHRIGISVDIDKSGMTDEQLDKLTEVMKSLGGIRNSEKPQIHYGFDGGN